MEKRYTLINSKIPVKVPFGSFSQDNFSGDFSDEAVLLGFDFSSLQIEKYLIKQLLIMVKNNKIFVVPYLFIFFSIFSFFSLFIYFSLYLVRPDSTR